MRKYELGEEITVLHKLVREKQGNKYWWKIQMLPKVTDGIVVGIRTLTDGENNKFGIYEHREHKRAVLVAINLKQTILMFAK
jgi:hypothetical protein